MDIPKVRARAFTYRAGVRIVGTVVACDAAAGGDLTFLSHAAVLEARGRRALPGLGGGRRQLFTTEATLALLGPLGEHLRGRALVVPFGRPFTLGDLRLELFPSGHLPGAASLLCERAGRRVVYAGPIGEGAEVRAADALCLDARFAAADASFPTLAAAEDAVRALGRGPRGADVAPVVLVDPPALAPRIARLLTGAGATLRASRAILDAVAAYRRAEGSTATGPAASQTPARFAGRLGLDEILLWPAGAPLPSQGGQARERPRVLVSPCAGSAAARAQVGAARGVTFPFGGDRDQLGGYAAATGAGEVALVGAPDEALATALRERGLDVYPLGAPRQIDLFAAA